MPPSKLDFRSISWLSLHLQIKLSGKPKPADNKSFKKTQLTSNVRHDEPQCSEIDCQVHKKKTSHTGFKWNLSMWVKERWAGSYSGYCFPLWVLWFPGFKSLTCSEPIEASNKLVNWFASEVAFSEFWAFRPPLTNGIILRTEASVFWNILHGVIKMSNMFFPWNACITCQINFLQLFSQHSQRCQIFISLDSHEMLLKKL